MWMPIDAMRERGVDETLEVNMAAYLRIVRDRLPYFAKMSKNGNFCPCQLSK